MSKSLALLLVAGGGAAGAAARYLIDEATRRALAAGSWATFPAGTLVVNVAGCFLLAFLVGLSSRGVGSPGTGLALGTGFLGGLTTFSTFGLEAVGLLGGGRTGAATVYLVGSLGLGAVAVLLGWTLAASLPVPGRSG